VPGAGFGFGQERDDLSQRDGDLSGQVGWILALVATCGLAGKHDPPAGTLERDAVRKASRFRPFGRLQDAHGAGSPGKWAIVVQNELTEGKRMNCRSLAPIGRAFPDRNSGPPGAGAANLPVANRGKVADTDPPSRAPIFRAIPDPKLPARNEPHTFQT
jgi:hypothetical protein